MNRSKLKYFFLIGQATFLLFKGASVQAGDVYLSLSTSPQRLMTLDSLFEPLKKLINSDKITGVIINIPNFYRNDRSQAGLYNHTIIRDLETLFDEEYGGKIHFNPAGLDLGPATKILPTITKLTREGKLTNNDLSQPNTIVVSIDDDQVYVPEAIEKFIAVKNTSSHVDHDAVLTVGGGVLEHWFKEKDMSFPDGIITNKAQSKRKSKAGWPVDLVEGYSGIAYYASDIDVPMMTALATQTTKDCFLSDDLVISYVLGLYHHKKIRIWPRQTVLQDFAPDFVRITSEYLLNTAEAQSLWMNWQPKETTVEFMPHEFTDIGALYLGSGYTEDEIRERKGQSVDALSGDNKIDSDKYSRCLRVLRGLTTDDDKQFMAPSKIKRELDIR